MLLIKPTDADRRTEARRMKAEDMIYEDDRTDEQQRTHCHIYVVTDKHPAIPS